VRTIAVGLFVLALTGAGCGPDRTAAPEPEEEAADEACTSDDDCADDLVCRRRKCVEPPRRQRARVPRQDLPSTEGVTPAGVKREVDNISRGYERKVDQSLDQ
jgi:hypothetical protein